MKNVLESFRQKRGLTYEALGEPAGYGRPRAWGHCRAQVISGEAALRYHRAWGIPLEDLRPDLYEQPSIPPPPASEQAQAHDDTEQGDSAWTSAV
jgi:hypothetical protein